MVINRWYRCALVIILSVGSLSGMVDNRFLVQNLFQKPFFIHTERQHHFVVQPFAMTARSAFGRMNGVDEESGLFEVYGRYDQKEIDKALQRSGRTSESLFRSDWRGYIGGIPWIMQGHLDIFGLGGHYCYEINDYCKVGTIFAVMHATSRLEMIRDPFTPGSFFIEPGNERELFLIKEEMNQALGVCPGVWQKTGVADWDIYVRLGYKRDYYARCHRFDVGVRLGMLAPTAPARNINNPASFPLGGNKHWGMYVSLEGDFDIHEDIQAGVTLQFIKRFDKTQCHRMPSCNEPENYGAVVGLAAVDPGLTIGFNPYITFKEVRDGLGFFLAYNLTAHEEDNWRPCGAVRALHPHTRSIEKVSEWRAEHATIGVMYDTGAVFEERCHHPVVTFTWDIPVDWLLSQRSLRTHGISFLFETQF